MKRSASSSAVEKLDRKTVERNRRIHMKGLCHKLFSLIPPHQFNFKPSKEMLSQQAQLDQAANYINQLKERIEKLKERKQLAMCVSGSNSNIKDSMINGLRLPFVEVKELDSIIEVVLISGLEKKFALHEVISVVEEEGAEVVLASTSPLGNKVSHTLHAQVRFLRVGVDTSRINQRLQELVSDTFFSED